MPSRRHNSHANWQHTSCTFNELSTPARPHLLTPSDNDILAFVRDKLKLVPDERQIEVLTSTAKRGILNCTRQWGKSTIIAAKAIHRAYTQENITVLVAAPCDRQSGEFIHKSAELVSRLGIKPRGDGYNSTSILFPNRSRIVGLPGTEATVRGYSAVSMMLIDEAARVRDDMYKMLRPVLAVSEGDIWLMSTPFGKRGFFYECWQHGGPIWHRISVRATECPRIPASFLAEERVENGGSYFDQEYMCEFTDDGTDVFPRNLVEDSLDKKLPPLTPGRS